MAEHTILQQLQTNQKKFSEFIDKANARFTKLENLMEVVLLKLENLEKRIESSSAKIDSPTPAAPTNQQSLNFIPIDKQAKMDFPRVDRSDALHWIFKTKQYFKYCEVPDVQRLGTKQYLKYCEVPGLQQLRDLKPNLHRDFLIQKSGSVLQPMKLAKLIAVLSGLSGEPPSSKTSGSIQYRTRKRMTTSTSESPITQILSVVTNSNRSTITRGLQVLDRRNFILVYDPGDVRSKEELKWVEAIYPIISIFYEVPNIVLLVSLTALRFLPLFGMAFQPLHPNFVQHMLTLWPYKYLDFEAFDMWCISVEFYMPLNCGIYTDFATRRHCHHIAMKFHQAAASDIHIFFYEHFTELEYLLIGLVSTVPSFLIPMLLVGNAAGSLFGKDHYWVKVSLWIITLSYDGNYSWTHYFIAYLETLGWSILFIMPLCLRIQCLPSFVSNAWLNSCLPPCFHYSFDVLRSYMSWVVKDCLAYINWVTPHITRIQGFTTVSVLAHLRYYFMRVESYYHGPISLTGCCWAFSTVAIVEGVNNLVTGDLISLSEQALVDYPTKFNAEYNGGFIDYAFQSIINNGSIDTEEDCSYRVIVGQCDQYRKNAKVVTTPANDEKALKKAVAHQIVSVAMEAGSREFQVYVSDVFTGRCGPTLDHEFHLYVSGVSTGRCGIKLDHSGSAGILIGWSFCLVFEGNKELKFVLHHYLLFFIDEIQHFWIC